jgi:hypothetical protein
LLRLPFAQGIQSAHKIYVDDRPHAARLGRALSSKRSRAQANAHGLRRRSDAAGRHHCGAGADLAHQLLELGDKKEAPGCHRPARCAYTASAIFISASGLTNLALIRSVDAKRWSAAAIPLVALMLLGAYSVTAALGSAAGGRANAAAIEVATADARARAFAVRRGRGAVSPHCVWRDHRSIRSARALV